VTTIPCSVSATSKGCRRAGTRLRCKSRGRGNTREESEAPHSTFDSAYATRRRPSGTAGDGRAEARDRCPPTPTRPIDAAVGTGVYCPHRSNIRSNTGFLTRPVASTPAGRERATVLGSPWGSGGPGRFPRLPAFPRQHVFHRPAAGRLWLRRGKGWCR
jgi:hypothetical protein